MLESATFTAEGVNADLFPLHSRFGGAGAFPVSWSIFRPFLLFSFALITASVLLRLVSVFFTLADSYLFRFSTSFNNAIHTFARVQLHLECAEILKRQEREAPAGRAKSCWRIIMFPAWNLPKETA